MAIVLAAGGSTRMGSAKALLMLDGRALVHHHVECLARRARRVVVVLGHQAVAHRSILPPEVGVVVNRDWATTWPADSLQLALLQEAITGPCWVTPVDTPPALPTTLDALIAAGAPAVPVDGSGQAGHPVLVDRLVVEQLRSRAPDGGLRTLLGEAARVPVPDPMVAADFDRPETWARFVARRSAQRGSARLLTPASTELEGPRPAR